MHIRVAPREVLIRGAVLLPGPGPETVRPRRSEDAGHRRRWRGNVRGCTSQTVRESHVFDGYNVPSDGDLRDAASRLGHTGGHTKPVRSRFRKRESAKSLGNPRTVRWPRG